MKYSVCTALVKIRLYYVDSNDLGKCYGLLKFLCRRRDFLCIVCSTSTDQNSENV